MIANVGLDVLVAIGLIGVGAGAGAAIVWFVLTRRNGGSGRPGPGSR